MLSTDFKKIVTLSDVGIAAVLEYVYQNIIDGISPSYTPPVGGFILNNEAEYNAITWTDVRPKPDWATVSGTYFNAWYSFYKSQTMTYGKLQEALVGIVDVSLATKVNGKSGMYLHEAQATSDSASTVTIHLTVDGLSTGVALFSGIPKVIATGKDSTGSPIASPQVAELAWSNSNKTVTFKTSRATNMLLLGNSAVATGAGAVIDVLAYGVKA